MLLSVMIVAKLDRLSRALLDLGIDPSTPAGEFLASVMARAAQWEASHHRPANEGGAGGQEGGWCPPWTPPAAVGSGSWPALEPRDDGQTLSAISEGLNGDLVPTAQGGARWYPATVRKVLLSFPPTGAGQTVARK